MCFKEPETHITSEGEQTMWLSHDTKTNAYTSAMPFQTEFVSGGHREGILAYVSNWKWKKRTDYSSFALYLQCDTLY